MAAFGCWRDAVFREFGRVGRLAEVWLMAELTTRQLPDYRATLVALGGFIRSGSHLSGVPLRKAGRLKSATGWMHLEAKGRGNNVIDWCSL